MMQARKEFALRATPRTGGLGAAAGVFTSLALFAFIGVGCATAQEAATMSMTVTSTAFQEGGSIPVQYTCKGAGISPPLAWSGVPEGAKSLALIVDDPDAPMGTWVHWVLFNIPPKSPGLPEAVPAGAALADGTVQAIGSSRQNRFQGPCPPSGTHRYFFKLYALDAMLPLGAQTSKQALLDAIKGHVLAQGELMGRFSK